MEPVTPNSSPAIPIAIVVGFGMIALAIFFTNQSDTTARTAAPESPSPEATSAEPRPVTENDYIRGNPNAPILLVEYSDYECPFCKQFHTTMQRVMEEYGVGGRVAWVYRQFPLAQLHPNAPKISEAALCVGDLGGSDAFWSFTDRIFNERDIDSPTNVTRLPQYAEEAGVSVTDYASCVNSQRMESEVLASVEDGFNAGAQGTPYTVVMIGDQEAVINGAQPYNVVKGIIDNLLTQLDGSTLPDVPNANASELE